MKPIYGDARLQLIVNQNFSHMTIEIYGLVDHGGGHPFIVGYDGEKMIEQELNEKNETAPWNTFKPLLVINRFMFDSLVKAFVEIANDHQIHTEGESALQGKLSAKEAHLADMQEMSKKLLDALIKIKLP
jgi:hypothetical protein